MKLFRRVKQSSGAFLFVGLTAFLCILSVPARLPSQDPCCQDLPPMCDCGACCVYSQWQCCSCSPVIIDTAGNGFSLTSASGGVWFDLSAKGTKRRIAWTAANSDDGFLVFDRNGNGLIDDGGELFGSFTPQPQSREPNGFLALATFDKVETGGNGDGTIDTLDTVFAKLQIWVDKDHNGLSEPSELFSLPQSDIHSIDLHYQIHRFTDEYGNEFRYRAKLTGSKYGDFGKWAYDVILLPESSSASNRGGTRPEAWPSQGGSLPGGRAAGNQPGCANTRSRQK